MRALMTGVPVKSLDANGVVGVADGEAFSVASRSGQKGRNITMQVYFSVAPTATDIAIQGTNTTDANGVPNNWNTVDSSTNVAGGSITAVDFNFKFVRVRKVAQTGAADATAELLMS